MKADIPCDGAVVRGARLAVKAELEKKRVLNQPIARFDPKTGRVWLESADGTVTEMGYAMKNGRYSQRKF